MLRTAGSALAFQRQARQVVALDTVGQSRVTVRAYGESHTIMSFCDHCEGQRFDRARVLRILRTARQEARVRKPAGTAEQALLSAIEAVRTMDIPHLERLSDEVVDGEVVH